ncbi:MAG TPA: hypothetical protein VGQ37_17335 [Vicinamibacterales bacterium]|nr:hypothetical protein [Vicinamibacterales bacterium]
MTTTHDAVPREDHETSRRRVLVVLNEPGYFRLYGPTIVELERRGWDVVLAYDRPAKRGGAQVPSGAGARVRSAGAIPDVGHAGLVGTLRAALDYVRYLEPAFAPAEYLRRRAEKTLPPAFGWLTRVRRLPRAVVSGAVGLMRLFERLHPAERATREFVVQVAPDLIVVSPLVTAGARGGPQTEVVKAAKSLGIPTVVGVASWDHLTSKGLIRVVPDVVAVWNDAQTEEAVTLHRVPRQRVVVSGAQSFDHWFEMSDGPVVAAWRTRLGIQDQRVVLFVGSSRNMAPGDSEPEFVRRWLAALRASRSPAVRAAFVIVRPHPTNADTWATVEIGDSLARIYPSGYSGIPLADHEVEDFGRCLQASDAVVGVNTTAMIEAAIFGRPVLTVRDANFTHSQAQTLHFAHLTVGETHCVVEAATLAEHVAQLDAALRNPAPHAAAARRFVERFVRPLGIERAATAQLCDLLERSAGPTRRLPRASFATPAEAARP